MIGIQFIIIIQFINLKFLLLYQFDIGRSLIQPVRSNEVPLFLFVFICEWLLLVSLFLLTIRTNLHGPKYECNSLVLIFHWPTIMNNEVIWPRVVGNCKLRCLDDKALLHLRQRTVFLTINDYIPNYIRKTGPFGFGRFQFYNLCLSLNSTK